VGCLWIERERYCYGGGKGYWKEVIVLGNVMKKPHILINILTHGDELIGLKVKKELEKLNIKQGILDFQIANEKAYKEKKRFIDSDLNRVFPGKKNGNYEEKLATKLLPKIKSVDLVIDIHSTTSDLKDALIVTKLNKKTKELINVINPKHLLFMNISKKTALISFAPIGISFEYGKDKDKKVLNKIVRDIKKLLKFYKMIDGKNSNKLSKTLTFKINKSFEKKPEQELDSKIRNYKLIKKGDVVARNKEGKVVIAKEDFYPILFGNKNYETMFGFIGKKL
jgi:succinylglutamate desuccinylase